MSMKRSIEDTSIVMVGAGRLATNLATAELLIKSLDRGDLDWREMYR